MPLTQASSRGGTGNHMSQKHLQRLTELHCIKMQLQASSSKKATFWITILPPPLRPIKQGWFRPLTVSHSLTPPLPDSYKCYVFLVIFFSPPSISANCNTNPVMTMPVSALPPPSQLPHHCRSAG